MNLLHFFRSILRTLSRSFKIRALLMMAGSSRFGIRVTDNPHVDRREHAS